MRVLVIPEDPTLDQYVLKPVLRRLFADLGRKARIDVMLEPHLGGVDEALSQEVLAAVLERHRMADLLLLIVDRDCQQGRQSRLDARRRQAEEAGRTLIGCLAIEEVEVWALALADDPPAAWQEIRRECHPKEVYFEPFVRQKGWLREPGRGRAAVMEALRGNWQRLKSRCPELETLRQDVADWLDTQSAEL